MIVKLGNDHLVAGTDPADAASATSMATLPLHTATPCAQPISLRELGLELLDKWAFGGNPARLDALDEILLLVAVENGRLTGIMSDYSKFKLLRHHCRKSRLVRVADVRALLYLDHVEVF